MKKQFNYCVGHYWKGDSGSIGCYAFGSEVHFGTKKQAKDYLEYVKQRSPEEDWKIFVVTEII